MTPSMQAPSRHQQEHPEERKDQNQRQHRPGEGQGGGRRRPPDALPNPLPGLDPQRSPGIDRAGDEGERLALRWLRMTREL